MKSIIKVIFPLAMIALILLASPGAVWQGKKASISKNTSAPTGGGTLNKEAVMAKAASLAVPFVRNAGRFDKEVRYSADLFSGRFFLTDKELVYSLMQRSKKKISRQDKGFIFKEFFVDEIGGRIPFILKGEDEGTAKISYFRGNDPAKWQSGLASYNSVSLGQVCPGIEVKLKASGKNVEKIFYMSPRSDVAKIKIVVAGVQGLEITRDGRLLFKNGLGELAMRAPVAWQVIAGVRRKVKVDYRVLGKHRYGFTVSENYSRDYPLVIDPALDTLAASTILGGNTADECRSIALDSSGNVYITGITNSTDFPTTSGAYDRELNPIKNDDYPYGDYYPDDVFISKLNGDLTELLASTYLGGERDEPDAIEMDEDRAYSLALDREGNVYITGSTGSPDFPTTPGAFDRILNGGDFYYHEDAFVAKLSGDLTRLMASTYLGGGYFEVGRSLVLDGTGNVFLLGDTTSSDFPTTPGAYDRTRNSINLWDWDVFISKLNGSLTELLASTYLGGNEYDRSYSLALDGAGDVYLTGSTASANFPIAARAFDRTYNGDTTQYSHRGDVFVAKLNGRLNALLAATYLGGSLGDGGCSLALDREGNVYLTGGTLSPDFPTTPGAYDRSYNGGDPVYFLEEGDIFISKLNGDLTRLLGSTFLGGSYSEKSGSLVLDVSGKVYVIGETDSTDFPTTPGAYDRTYNGGKRNLAKDVFVAQLDRDLGFLRGSTFLGGGVTDYGRALVMDGSGILYATGTTYSTDFPTTVGAYDRGHHGVFISKLGGDSLPAIGLKSPDGGESWIAGTVRNITWEATAKIVDVRIEVSTDNGKSWSDISVAPARYRTYSWTVPNTPSRQCLVRISDNDHPDINDTCNAVFSILMNIDLLAERREVRAFSIVRQYGRVQFLIGNSSVPVTQYRIMRRKSGENFALLKEIVPSELQNNQFQMQDKYLEKGTTYTYRIEAYDATGQPVGISSERTI